MLLLPYHLSENNKSGILGGLGCFHLWALKDRDSIWPSCSCQTHGFQCSTACPFGWVACSLDHLDPGKCPDQDHNSQSFALLGPAGWLEISSKPARKWVQPVTMTKVWEFLNYYTYPLDDLFLIILINGQGSTRHRELNRRNYGLINWTSSKRESS